MRRSKSDKAFAAGYGCAIAGLARDHYETQLAWFIASDSGIPLKDFEASGLDPYDLDVIRELFSENEQAAA